MNCFPFTCWCLQNSTAQITHIWNGVHVKQNLEPILSIPLSEANNLKNDCQNTTRFWPPPLSIFRAHSITDCDGARDEYIVPVCLSSSAAIFVEIEAKLVHPGYIPNKCVGMNLLYFWKSKQTTICKILILQPFFFSKQWYTATGNRAYIDFYESRTVLVVFFCRCLFIKTM